MERVLTILTRSHGAKAALTASSKLLTRLPGSRLSLLYPRPCVDPSFMPTEEMYTDDRRKAFDDECDRTFVALQRDLAAQSSPAWPRNLLLRQIVGKTEKVIKDEAAHADLLIMANAGHEQHQQTKVAIETSLFKTTLPLLLIPEAIAQTFARHAVIAWERSQAADEAIGAALPLLLTADKVTVLIAKEDHDWSAPPNGLLQTLEQRGNSPQIRQVTLGDRNIGEALLAEAHAVGADLLVMGAFTHPRMFEALFGGATRQLLANATIPLLMHH